MPRNRGKRVRIAPYTYQDAQGISAIAKVAGRRPREKRFALGTKPSTIDAWIKSTRKALSAHAATIKTISAPGTLGAIIVKYLTTIVDEAAHREATALLTPWIIAVGHTPISKLELSDLRRTINTWAAAGAAASTLNHRRREFAKAWDVALPDRSNLVRKLRRQREPKPKDRAFDMHVLDAIIETIPDTILYGARWGEWNLTKLFLKALLWTGFPGATLGRIRPQDHDYARSRVRVVERLKGGGVEEVVMPLFPEGNAALHRLMLCRAWGHRDKASVWKTFARAFRRYTKRMAKAGTPTSLPDDLHPYDLRHSFLSWLVDEKDADPWTVQFYGRHASMETTKRYVKRSIARRAERLARGTGPTGGQPISAPHHRTEADLGGHPSADTP